MSEEEGVSFDAAEDFVGHEQKTLPSGLQTAVELVRRKLLDIGKRNRLIHTPLANRRSKQIAIVDELTDEVFRTLSVDKKSMSFLPIPDDDDVEEESQSEPPVYVPPEEKNNEGGLASRHTDLNLQTNFKREALQKKLLSLHLDARSMEEEQGVNVLYLGLGFLKWYENEKSDVERYAPLILLPVELSRDNVRGRFRLTFRDQDLEPNLSLQALLDSDFQISLPNFPDLEEWCPSDYFRMVIDAISRQPRWSVEPDTMSLGFYSFAKFLMWRDLNPEVWPEGTGFDNNDLIHGLLIDGFEEQSSLFAPDENLDDHFVDVKRLGHVMDADASQAQVIETVRRGRNLVVQGPPGTGKSQTIANIIATAVQDGKRVLFVAEKMAALEVVHQRLEDCQLGPVCLELHSRKANKRTVLEELNKTLNLGIPKAVDQSQYASVVELRDRLNHISDILHEPDPINGITPYQAMGRLARLAEKGCSPPRFKFPDAAEWSPEKAESFSNAVDQLATLTDKFGSELANPWRGVQRRLSPMDRTRLTPQFSEALEALEKLKTAWAKAILAFSFEENASGASIDGLLSQLRSFISMPSKTEKLLASELLKSHLTRSSELVNSVCALRLLKIDLENEVTSGALDRDWRAEHREITTHGGSLFRILFSSYRGAVARLRSACTSDLPSGFEGRVKLLDNLIEYRRRELELADEDEFGRQAFGDLWSGRRTSTEELREALDWIQKEVSRLQEIEIVAARVLSISDECDFSSLATDLENCWSLWRAKWQVVSEGLKFSLALAFRNDCFEDISLDDFAERLRRWVAFPEGVEDWNQLHAAAELLTQSSIEPIRDGLADGSIKPGEALDLYRFGHAEGIWDSLCKRVPELDRIDGAERTVLVQRFRELDSELKQLAAQEIALAHFHSLPRGGAGQMGVLRGEIGKKRRHMALRKLMDSAGEAISKIKPVFLMSPLSVAQYLRPGGIDFDLLVMDEASQIRPEDALGAILRSKQIVVVGDRHQLPPTSFFSRMTEGTDQEDDSVESIQASQVGDMESILTLCSARSISDETLRWHYRSKHPSLIAVSNQSFYANKLVFPPSPEFAGSSAGLSFQKVAGVYDRGATRSNAIEAECVANAVLEHAKSKPHLSLGVVTFSVAQRDAIQNQLEFLRAGNPELETFFSESRSERFFIKNLENVQGDERDAIFVSVCYGRDADGYMSQSFGPVTAEGGERRLNVLFTRAKLSCRIFSSISYQDIRDDVSKNKGPRILKRYLKYAETGEIDVPKITGAEMDSPFEEAVAAAIQTAGYSVEAQVGSAGFLINLAIYDPDNEGRFLLAVECDGATYHSSRWARERDRLRQTVLESKGWIVHRIWSTDWFRKPDAEMEKLLTAIDAARKPERTVVLPTKKRSVERLLAVDAPHNIKYVEADFPISQSGQYELHEAPSEVLLLCISKIVEIEGPIHINEVARRLSRLWGYQRAGQRIQSAVRMLIRSAVESGRLALADPANQDFVVCEGSDLEVVRDRKSVLSSTLRRVENLPPTEIQEAILNSIQQNIALSVSACSVVVARMVGFQSTSADFRNLVEDQSQNLIADGRISLEEDELRPIVED